jgi:hypothetical protein
VSGAREALRHTITPNSCLFLRTSCLFLLTWSTSTLGTRACVTLFLRFGEKRFFFVRFKAQSEALTGGCTVMSHSRELLQAGM